MKRGCRWLDSEWRIHHVQEMLGHSNLSQTSTYLHADSMGLAESMKQFDASCCKPVANEERKDSPPVGNAETTGDEKSTVH